MNGVILDKNSFDKNDIDISELEVPPVTWHYFNSTKSYQTLERISQCEIVITNKVILDTEILKNCENLKLILIAATGTDNVDLDFCTTQEISVCNVKHYATPAVAQHTICLMLNLLTRQTQYIDDVQKGLWSQSDVFCLLDYPIVETKNKTLGIIGYGTLGKKVAAIADAMEMEILICQRPGSNSTVDSNRVSFDELLQRADVISLHCPLTAQTQNLFSEVAFKKMKNSAVLINTARGAIIDSVALVNALKAGELSGAGIDVFDKEPPPIEHPLLQDSIPNLLITPHNAWGSRESRQRLIQQLSANLIAWLNNSPINVVN